LNELGLAGLQAGMAGAALGEPRFLLCRRFAAMAIEAVAVHRLLIVAGRSQGDRTVRRHFRRPHILSVAVQTILGAGRTLDLPGGMAYDARAILGLDAADLLALDHEGHVTEVIEDLGGPGHAAMTA